MDRSLPDPAGRDAAKTVRGLAPAQGRAAPSPTPQCRHKTILIVDDAALVRDMISRFLRKDGFAVLCAANADEALSLAKACLSLDLLITDYQMPGMNGLELATRIHGTHPETKLLLMSGTLLDTGCEASTLPAWIGYLTKPFNPAQLLGMVRKLIPG